MSSGTEDARLRGSERNHFLLVKCASKKCSTLSLALPHKQNSQPFYLSTSTDLMY